MIIGSAVLNELFSTIYSMELLVLILPFQCYARDVSVRGVTLHGLYVFGVSKDR